MLQADAQCLPATHREPGHGAVLAVGMHRVMGLDKRNNVLEQIVLEGAVVSEPARPERPLGGAGALPLGPAARRAKPLGMTTIMGTIFLAA